MKYLKMFEAVAALFPRNINVTLVDATTGNGLGKHKIPAELLPAVFNRPTTLEIQGINWRILKADPVSADDFLVTKKLTLHVQNSASIDIEQLRFSLPTICNELPLSGATSLYHDFTLELAGSSWRQIEFLSLSRLQIVEEAIKTIETILTSQPNPLLGYERQYIRDNTIQPRLAIPWEAFCALLTNPVRGNVFFNSKGFVQNGFAVRSDSYIYYGILENEYIHTLCLNHFDWADDELMRVLSIYELSLVDWCNSSRISAEVDESLKGEFIKI